MNNSREKFEAWFTLDNPKYVQNATAKKVFERIGGVYQILTTLFSWKAWQAATEQSQKEIEALQAREKELVNLAKLTYGYLWHINAGLDAPAILNVTSITPEKCSHIVRKLWLDVLTKEQRGEGINKALEALAKVEG